MPPAQEIMSEGELLRTYVNQINQTVGLTACLTVAVTLLACLLMGRTRPVTDPPEEKSRRRRVAVTASIMALTCLAAMFAVGVLTRQVDIAIDHGLYDPDMPLRDIIRLNPVTPEESRLPSDDITELGDVTVIYYRYGCPDCEAVYPDLCEALRERQEDVYWISTRSAQGRALLQEYVVGDVPSILYIYPDARGHAILSLHEKDELTGKTVLPADTFALLDQVRAKARSESRGTVLDMGEIVTSELEPEEPAEPEKPASPTVTLIWQLLEPTDFRLAMLE